MRRETSDIVTETTPTGALATALEFEAYRRHFDDSMEQRAGVIIDQLLRAGFEIVRATEKPILTVEELLAALATARASSDGDKARSLVNLGTSLAIDADLDIEFAHDGIYWDAPDEDEVARADATQERAKADLDRLLTDAGIEAEYREELQGQHYQDLRAVRTRAPALSDEDEYA